MKYSLERIKTLLSYIQKTTNSLVSWQFNEILILKLKLRPWEIRGLIAVMILSLSQRRF